VLSFLGSCGPIPRFLLLTLIGVSAIWGGVVHIGYPMPAIFDSPYASLWIPPSTHS